MVVDLAAVDAHLGAVEGGDVEPGREAARLSFRRGPVRELRRATRDRARARPLPALRGPRRAAHRPRLRLRVRRRDRPERPTRRRGRRASSCGGAAAPRVRRVLRARGRRSPRERSGHPDSRAAVDRIDREAVKRCAVRDFRRAFASAPDGSRLGWRTSSGRGRPGCARSWISTRRFARLGAWIAAVDRRAARGVGRAARRRGALRRVGPGSPAGRRARGARQRVAIGGRRRRRAASASAAPTCCVLYRNPDGDVRDAALRLAHHRRARARARRSRASSAPPPSTTPTRSTLVSRDGRETLVIVSLAGGSAEKLRTFHRIEPLLRAVEAPVEVQIGGLVAFTLLVQDVAREDAAQAEADRAADRGGADAVLLPQRRRGAAAGRDRRVRAGRRGGAGALRRELHRDLDLRDERRRVPRPRPLDRLRAAAGAALPRGARRAGATRGEAVAATLDTAGRAVWISGLTVDHRASRR